MAATSLIVLLSILVPATASGHAKLFCKPSVGTAQVDPIVSPGDHHSAHMHTFFANKALLDLSEPEKAKYAALIGKDTTCQNMLDSASYWTPTLYTKNGPLAPRAFIAYYRSFDHEETGSGHEAFPKDMRLVAGNALATGPQDKGVINWTCNANSSRRGPYSSPAEANCALATGTVYLTAHIDFPSCWDGKLNTRSLDKNTADFSGTAGSVQNHLAYTQRGECPAGFPRKLPELRMTVSWNYQGTGRDVQLASGTTHSLHADFWNTWVQDGLQKMVDTCINTSTSHPHGNVVVCGQG